MSNTDPDLKPTEKNLPIAIDVVDGQLVVKRHNGKEESFPLGSAFINEDWLEWYIDDTAVPSGTEFNQLGPATGTALYDKTYSSVGPDVVVEDIPTDGHGLEVGDNFVFADKTLYFRKSGVYKAVVVTTTPGVSNTWVYRLYTSLSGGSYSGMSNFVRPDVVNDAAEQLIFVVHPDYVLHNTAEELWAPGDLISPYSQGLIVDGWQNTGDVGEILLDIYVSRILG